VDDDEVSLTARHAQRQNGLVCGGSVPVHGIVSRRKFQDDESRMGPLALQDRQVAAANDKSTMVRGERRDDLAAVVGKGLLVRHRLLNDYVSFHGKRLSCARRLRFLATSIHPSIRWICGRWYRTGVQRRPLDANLGETGRARVM